MIQASANIPAARLAAARRGRHLGRTPFGFIRLGAGELVPHPREAAVVRAIFREYLRRRTMREVVRWLRAADVPVPHQAGRWYREAVGFVLANRTYLGEVRFRGAWGRGAHDAIVSREEWDAAARVRVGNGRGGMGRG